MLPEHRVLLEDEPVLFPMKSSAKCIAPAHMG